ncbi:Predicted arabinose efflux permease, MFS family [Rhodococcus rhodochrous J3]|uniref:Predicted arabinose efflux permease, MFS family n=1 Tax=Rhodococcus rhodochrous J3 TaxID=903528 RepID=A0ABY1M433_RHORH|nr:MFS transporter [Rhodococcus rhodochrous]MDO1486060.1 MHS family MFS transporter [Rhodococcus rhodochrous]TWH63688.1 putative MFS family arabinose efflux permease [Rhodococcus rhodochrous J38]SMG06284.1 Predicted arabinose efflux permease, MFS family [Rhodococcus rhodochrous J3]SNV17361.1 MFS transporter [Rhodococcus rhodochrous]
MTAHAASSFGTKQQKRAFLASLVGTTVEWFDFFIYATAATLVFSTIFFPELGSNVGILASFATLGVAFLARPVGAFVFGHLGDRLGRRTTLITTLTVMGAATGLIGLLPTWDQVGIWAPIMLTALRFLQGVAVGGEWGGAVLMSVENAPKTRERFYGSAPQIASPLALVLATVVMYFVARMPNDQLMSWGWRIPFLAGFVLVLIGLVIRLGVEESSEFTEVKETGTVTKNPIATVLRTMPSRVLAGIGLQASVIVLFYLITTYMLTMATNIHGFTKSDTLMILLIAATIDLFAMVGVGILCDRLSAWTVFVGGVVFTGAFAFPLFALFNTGNMGLMIVAFSAALVLGHATTYAVVSSMTANLFPTEVRYSGVALCSAFSGVAWAAPTPLVAAALVPTDGSQHWWPLAAILVGTAVVSFVAAASMRSHFTTGAASDDRDDQSRDLRVRVGDPA